MPNFEINLARIIAGCTPAECAMRARVMRADYRRITRNGTGDYAARRGLIVAARRYAQAARKGGA